MVKKMGGGDISLVIIILRHNNNVCLRMNIEFKFKGETAVAYIVDLRILLLPRAAGSGRVGAYHFQIQLFINRLQSERSREPSSLYYHMYTTKS